MPTSPARAAGRARTVAGPVLVAALLAAACFGGGSGDARTGAVGGPVAGAGEASAPPAAPDADREPASTGGAGPAPTAPTAQREAGAGAVGRDAVGGTAATRRPTAPAPVRPPPRKRAAHLQPAQAPPRPDVPAEPHHDPAAGSGADGTAGSAQPADATVEGAVLRAWAEPGAGDQEPALLTYLDTGTEQVQVPTSSLQDLGGNAWVRARLGGQRPATGDADARAVAEGGREVLAADVLAGGEPVEQVQAALPAAAAHKVTVAMVAPAGAVRDATSLVDVVAAVEGPVSSFWSDQTQQAVTFDVTATQDWFTSSATCADATGMWDEAAARTGWTAGPGKHLLLYVTTATDLPGCYAGLGTVGSGTTSGGRAYVRGTGASLVAHELGHNMGLSHSDGLVCAGGADGVWSGSAWGNGCAEQGYRDYYDVMGISWPYLGTLTSQHATFLGAMTTGHRVDVAAPTRAVLAPVSSLVGVRALKLVEHGATYWVEFRPRAGRDSWLDGGNYRSLSSGVLVRRVNPRSARASLLLDATPSGSTGDWAANLPVSQSFTTAGGRFVVTVEQVGADGATVAVAVDGVDPATTTTPDPEPEPEPAPEPSPTPGATLTVQSPAEGARLPEGTVRFAGSGSAPEGMLFWELRDGSGVLAQRGFAHAGANGEPGTWAVDRVVPVGDWTMAVRVPDDSDGEGETAPPWVVRSFSVR